VKDSYSGEYPLQLFSAKSRQFVTKSSFCITSAFTPLDLYHHSTSNPHDICCCRTEVVVPCSRSKSHCVVIQKVRINELTQLSAVAKRRHATVGLNNPLRIA
jgi:hypothetical protein